MTNKITWKDLLEYLENDGLFQPNYWCFSVIEFKKKSVVVKTPLGNKKFSKKQIFSFAPNNFVWIKLI